MLILVTYDVNTTTPSGQSRLRKVAKYCESYGQRVQYSVFECLLDASQYVRFKSDILSLIDMSSDSIRFYNLGNKFKTKVEVIGVKKVLFDQANIIVI